MADRTTENKVYKSFSISSNLESGADIGLISRMEKRMEQIMRPFVNAGEIIKRVTGNAHEGSYRVDYSVNAGKNLAANIRAAVSEEIKSYNERYGSTFSMSRMRTSSFVETQERFLDDRTRAAIRAEVMSLGGKSSYNRDTGVTTYLVKKGQETKLHNAGDASYERYISGAAAGMPDRNPDQTYAKAMSIVARRNERMEIGMRATRDFAKANPRSQIARQERMRKRKAMGKFVKGGTGALVAIGVATVALLGKILNMVTETARNTLNAVSQGNKANISGVDVERFGIVSKKIGFNGSFVDSMGMLVGKFANPQNLAANINPNLVALLKGNVGDVTSFVSSGVVNPKNMLMKIFASTLTDVAAGRGSLSGNNDMDSALSAALANMSSGLDAGTAEGFSKLVTYMRANGALQPGQTFTAEGVASYLNSLGLAAGTVPSPSQTTVAAAAVGAQKIDALGADISGASNTLLTQAVSFLGEIATMLRNFLRPMLATIDPAGEATRNAAAVAHNRAQAAAVGADVTAGSAAFSRAYGKLTGRKLNPGTDAIKMERALVLDEIRNGTYNAAKYNGLSATKMLEFLNSDTTSSLMSDIDTLAELNGQLGGGVGGIFGVGGIKGATPEPTTDAITRVYKKTADAQKRYLEMVDLKQRYADLRALHASNKSSTAFDDLMLGALGQYPTRNEFNSDVTKTKDYNALGDKFIAGYGLDKLREQIGQSMMLGGNKIVGSDTLSLSSSQSGLLNINLSRDGKVIGSTQLDVAKMTLTKPIMLTGNDLLESASFAPTASGK